MPTAYELIADTRPRIRRDVLFTQSPSGVLFHNANGGFNLSGASAYRFASLIVPHLNGTNRVADLCAGLGEPQRRMVTELVRTLYEREFARDVRPDDDAGDLPELVARRFAAQIAYIDHYAGGAGERFGRFRDTRVAVLGEDAVARWTVLGLVRNGVAEIGVLPGIDAPGNRFGEVLDESRALDAQGCTSSISVLGHSGAAGGTEPRRPGLGWSDLAGYDVVLATGGAEISHRMLSLLQASVPSGRTLLPAWTYGAHAIVGPLMTAGTPGCWACAALRLGANGDPGDAAHLWSEAALTGAAPVGGFGGPGVGGGIGIGIGVGSRLNGPLSGMVGNLLAYEVFRLTTQALPPETRSSLIVQDLRSLDTHAEPLFPHPSCPFCTKHGKSETVGDVIGIVALGAEASREPGADLLDDPAQTLDRLQSSAVLVQPQAGVFTAFEDEDWEQVPLKVGTVRFGLGHTGRRTLSAFDVHHVAGARIRALQTAATVYADHAIPPAGVLHGEALELARAAWPSVGPRRLGIHSGAVADDDSIAYWVPVTRFGTDETALVPAAALRPFGAYNRDRLVLPTRAGIGAAGTPGQAVARALLSALGFAALVAALRGAPATRIALDALDGDPETAFLAKSARNLGADVELLELGDRQRDAAPVLLARARGGTDAPGEWALGCAPSWQEAAVGALRDLLGRIQLTRQLGTHGAAGIDVGDPLLDDLDAEALPVGGEAAPRLDVRLSWTRIVDQLRAEGDDVLVAPIAAPDLATGGIHVARVLLAREADDER